MKGNERGAALIQVALGITAMMAFATFVMDYGVFWTSRRQAQNSADAAAHAGAVALGFNNATDFTSSGPAKQSAYAESQRNPVWGQQPNVNITSDITFPTCPDGSANKCVRADVYRTVARGNPIPVFFGQLVGLTTQDVQATATAEVNVGTSVTCLRPFALPDKWSGPANGIFNPATDTYIPPSQANSTGYNLQNDYGTEVLLKGDSSDPPRLDPGWFMLLDVGNGGSAVRDQIGKCGGNSPWTIGQDLPAEEGGKVGPVKQGVDDLVGLNGSSPATWDPINKKILNNCVDTHTCLKWNSTGTATIPDPNATLNPQIVPIPVFDPALQQATGELKMVNVLGFFIEGMQTNKDVLGVFVTMPGAAGAGGGSPLPGAAFLVAITLVR
jgi:Flp pilus assembly protein TadG